MTAPKFTETASGWSAECRDCPHTIGADYGQPIYPRAEFTGDDAQQFARTWAALHRHQHPTHQPAVDMFKRFTFDMDVFPPGVLEALTGPTGAPIAHTLDEHQDDE